MPHDEREPRWRKSDPVPGCAFTRSGCARGTGPRPASSTFSPHCSPVRGILPTTGHSFRDRGWGSRSRRACVGETPTRSTSRSGHHGVDRIPVGRRVACAASASGASCAMPRPVQPSRFQDQRVGGRSISMRAPRGEPISREELLPALKGFPRMIAVAPSVAFVRFSALRLFGMTLCHPALTLCHPALETLAYVANRVRASKVETPESCRTARQAVFPRSPRGDLRGGALPQVGHRSQVLSARMGASRGSSQQDRVTTLPMQASFPRRAINLALMA